MGETSSKLNHSRWFSKNHRRVICVGLKAAGKTAITEYLTKTYPKAAKPLPEIGCYKFIVNKFTIVFYDLKGDDQSRFFWRHHYEGSQGVIFVIDLSDSSKFELTRQLLHELVSDPLLKNIPFVVFANKTDLAEPTNKEIIKETFGLNGNPLCEAFLSCAVSGDGVNDGMVWLSGKMNSVS